MAKGPSAEDLITAAEEIAKAEDVDLDSVDMSLPDGSRDVIEGFAATMYQHLLQYNLSKISARANGANGNEPDKVKMQQTANYHRWMVALLTKAYPGARAAMLRQIEARDKALEAAEEK